MTRWRVPGAVICLAVLVLAHPALAHERLRTTALPPEGVAIPSITHGQMAVVAANLPAIRALADRQFPTDPEMRRLQGYLNLQSFACLWGMVPQSITDDASPFNECAHAYLAAALTLFLHVRQMPNGDTPAARTLSAKMEMEMLREGASLVMCRYSVEEFSTAEVIEPDWRAIPSHLPSLLTFATFGTLPLAGWAAWSRLR